MHAHSALLLSTVREQDLHNLEEYIVEIFPASPAPHFELVANRLHAKNEQCLGFTSDVVIHRDADPRNQIIVWYFRLGASRRVNCSRFVSSVSLFKVSIPIAVCPSQ
jgi:hypothetical protein